MKTLPTHKFIQQFLMHVPPEGLHRIRHYSLFASAEAAPTSIERARQLLSRTVSLKESRDTQCHSNR